jgi:hypothetical protein
MVTGVVWLLWLQCSPGPEDGGVPGGGGVWGGGGVGVLLESLQRDHGLRREEQDAGRPRVNTGLAPPQQVNG